jgi:hypothetical protein
VQADCGRKDSRATPRRDFADVAYNFHQLAALGERSDNTLLRLEECSLLLILYMKEDCSSWWSANEQGEHVRLSLRHIL